MTEHKTVAKIILRDAQGRILVLHRSATHPQFGGHLDFPGGEVEQGEIAQDAARREALEEAGLVIDEHAIALAAEEQPDSHTTHLLFVTQVDTERPDVVVSWEHSLHEWLELDELINRPIPENVDDYYLFAVAHLRDTAENLHSYS